MKRNSGLMLFSVAMGTFMAALDASVVNIAAPAIRDYFEVPLGTVQWVITAYLIAVSSGLLFFGRLSDIYGQKKVYISGFAVFTAGSALCGLSNSALMLIALRVVQAVGAGMMFSTNSAIITNYIPAQRRGRAFGVNAMAVAVALSTGPVLGGALTGALGWQSIFYINIPVGIIGIALAVMFIPKDEKKPYSSLDIPGALLIFAALFLLLLPLERLAQGMEPLIAAGMMLAGAAFAVVFVLHERKDKDPLMPLTLFRSRVFSASLAASLLNYTAQNIMIFLVPFYFQSLRFFSPAKSGLLYIPMPLTMLLVAPAAGYIADRHDTRLLSSAGMAVMACGLFMLSFLTVATPLWYIVLAMAVTGLGSGMFQTPNNSAVMTHAPRSGRGVASGMLATARNIGMMTGVGLSGALFSLFSGGADMQSPGAANEAAFVYALKMTFLAASGVAIAAMAASLTKGRVNPAGLKEDGEA